MKKILISILEFFVHLTVPFSDYLLLVDGKAMNIKPLKGRNWKLSTFIEEFGGDCDIYGLRPKIGPSRFIIARKTQCKLYPVTAPINKFATALARRAYSSAPAIRGEAFFIRMSRIPELKQTQKCKK